MRKDVLEYLLLILGIIGVLCFLICITVYTIFDAFGMAVFSEFGLEFLADTSLIGICVSAVTVVTVIIVGKCCKIFD